jgi:glucose/arabinose dehydrogenase
VKPAPIFLLLLTACSAAPTQTTVPTPAPTPGSTLVTVPESTIPAPSTTAAPVTTTTTPLAPLEALSLEQVASGLDQPVLMLPMPTDGRSVVVERGGRVIRLGEDEPWMDISERVNSEDGIEPGLLGLAFHPDFAENGRFFVYYYRSAAEQTRLSEFAAPDGVVDTGSEIPLIDIDKPTNRHNGGMLQFGPDGYLYLSVGEGGKASLNAQNPSTLLGKILRIDVDGGDPYAIPDSNPYRSGGGAPEVIAYGLRNPWRTWIDPVEEIMYIADVGQEDWEEIDAVGLGELPGTNFGWLRMEGSSCFQAGCDAVTEGLTLPIVEYPHEEGCSITGGLVYRGKAIPELVGHYFYSDWCFGWTRSFRLEAGKATEEKTWFESGGQVNGYGYDAEGEIYLLTFEGTVEKIVPVRG